MNNDFLPNSVVLSLGCTLELPGECLKIIKKCVTAQNSHFIGLSSCLGIGDFTGSSGNVNI